MKKLLFILLSCVMIANHAISQKNEKTSYQEVKQQCAGLPLEKRARLSVTRFNVTTRTNDVAVEKNANANNGLKSLGTIFNGGNAPRADSIPVELGDNLSTMLTNALQEVNCFRVLETLKNNTDNTQEIDQGDSKYSSKKVPKAGKQLGPQIVVTGEVIEYSLQNKGLDVIVKTGKKILKMGFDIKMINPETRDIIVSKVFRVQSVVGKGFSTSAFLHVGRFWASGPVGSSNSDPAIAAILNDGVIQAVEYISHVRDSLNITADNIPGNATTAPNGVHEVEVDLADATFSSFNALASIITSLSGYKSMEKSLSSETGTYTVSYQGTSDSFLDELNKKLGTKYEITGFDTDKIELKAKTK